MLWLGGWRGGFGVVLLLSAICPHREVLDQYKSFVWVYCPRYKDLRLDLVGGAIVVFFLSILHGGLGVRRIVGLGVGLGVGLYAGE